MKMMQTDDAINKPVQFFNEKDAIDTNYLQARNPVVMALCGVDRFLDVIKNYMQ